MSDAERSGTRSHEHQIAIDAPVEAVWRAITDAEEITRWYVSEASIDLREGGTYRVSWGEGMDGESEITALEPGRRLRLAHRPPGGGPGLPGGPVLEEYVIESEGGRTVLRLVTSGIPDTEDWDWFYEGTKRGWTAFFLGLRHYLERHAGKPRDHVQVMQGLGVPFDEAWRTLAGPEGLGFTTPPDEAAAGDRYTGRTGFDQELAGEILLVNAPSRLVMTIEGLDDALFAAALEQMGTAGMLYLSLSTFGLEPSRVEALRDRWTAWAAALFPDVGGLLEGLESMTGGQPGDATPDA